MPADGKARIPLTALDGGTALVEIGEVRAVVGLLGGTAFAVDARCPHRGGPLQIGRLEGAILSCPWHAACFDVRSGDLVRGPDCELPLRVYSAEIIDGDVVIEAPESARGVVGDGLCDH